MGKSTTLPLKHLPVYSPYAITAPGGTQWHSQTLRAISERILPIQQDFRWQVLPPAVGRQRAVHYAGSAEKFGLHREDAAEWRESRDITI